MLEMVYKLRDYLESVIVPAVEGYGLEIVENMNKILDEIRSGIEAGEKARDSLYVDFTEHIGDLVGFINNKTGGADVQHVTLTADKTLVLDPVWPSNHPVQYRVTQDSKGGHRLTLNTGISGTVTVNPAAGAVTDFWIFPDGNGAWAVYQPSTLIDARIIPVAAAIREEMADGFEDTDKTVAELSTARASGDKANADALAVHAAKVTKIYPLDAVDAVFIGDSYFMGYQKNGVGWIKDMPTRITELLNAQGLNTYRMHNFGYAGSGFNKGGANNFGGQLSTAIAKTEITNCRLVVIGGGQNDAGTDVYNQTLDTIRRAKAKWPNAKIVVVPMWTPQHFRAGHRITFMSIYRAAKDGGAIADTNSLWVNATSDPANWHDENNVYHPQDGLTQLFAQAIHTLIQGGQLPAITTDIAKRASSGVSVGVVTVDGFSATVSLQHQVGAAFDASYMLGSVGCWAFTPGEVNQYVTGFAGSGSEIKLFTIEAGTGSVFLTGAGTAAQGLCGFTASYPLGM